MATNNLGPGQVQPLYSLFRDELSSKLADLRSLEADFTLARTYAEAYVNTINTSGAEDEGTKVVRRSLWTSALISYRRGFTTGKAHVAPRSPRLKVPDDWKERLTREQFEAHEAILKIANQHVAHRVGEQEHVTVMALLNPLPMPRKLIGLAVLTMDRSEPLVDLVARLGELCTVLIEVLKEQINRVSDEFESHVKSQELQNLYTGAQSELPAFDVTPHQRIGTSILVKMLT